MNKIPCSFVAYSFFDKLSRFQSYPTPYPALQSQLFRVFSALAQCSAGFIDVALGGLWAFITSTLPRTWPLYLSLSLSPSRSAAPDPNGDPDAYAAAAAAAERACFLMDFWLMFWALLWVPTPSRSHEPYSIDFQLRRGLSYATTLRWPNQSFDYRATTLDSKNILQHGTIYILYTVILYIRQWGSRCPSEARK